MGLPLYAHYGHTDVRVEQRIEQHLLESML